MAKVDTKLGYKNFDEILESADGIIIDRGKVSIELSTEKVMQAQKTMVAKANKASENLNHLSSVKIMNMLFMVFPCFDVMVFLWFMSYMLPNFPQVGKPIFGVCEYLNSMISRNCPTFAEATDVMNTIIEGILVDFLLFFNLTTFFFKFNH